MWKVTREAIFLINFFRCLHIEGNFVELVSVKFNIFSVSSENLVFFFDYFRILSRTFFYRGSETKSKNKFDSGFKREKSKKFSPVRKRKKKIENLFLPHSSIWVAKIQEKRYLSVSQWIKIIYVISQGKSEECRGWWKRLNEIKECEEEYWMKKQD